MQAREVKSVVKMVQMQHVVISKIITARMNGLPLLVRR